MSVKDCGGGWHGVYDDDMPKDAPPKRMFRTKQEAVALDSLLSVAKGKPNKPKKAKT